MDETGEEIARGFGSGYPGGKALEEAVRIISNSYRRILVDS
jgi:hypothetical protein